MRTPRLLILWAFILFLNVCSYDNLSADTYEELSADADGLAQIVLIISSSQVVGQPLITEARIILLDSNSNQLTSYDLAAHPITLISETGLLVPNVLDNQALLTGGVINILAAQIVYQGPTGNVEIYATDGTISSSNVIVSFNGYDILDAFDFVGNDISQIYSGLPTTIHVTVQNRGTRVAYSQPTVKTYFKSGGGSIKHIFYQPHANGIIDTLPIKLETPNLNPGQDTMIIELSSEYLISSTILTSFSQKRIPVTVYELATFEVVENSLVPDTVYPGVTFSMAFDIAAIDFPGQIDSTHLVIKLADRANGTDLTTIYQGAPEPVSYTDGIIRYSGLNARIDTTAGLLPGNYYIKLEYELISGGNIFSLENNYPDSLTLLGSPSLSYISGSLTPTEVLGGDDIAFSFNITLSGVSFLEILPESTLFTITGVGFTSAVNLVIPSNILNQGVNTITTKQIYIPVDQMGENLTVNSWFSYRQAGSANYLKFRTDFGGQTIAVTELPEVKIISLDALLPNIPRVNTGQQFQMRSKIANLSEVLVKDLELVLSTNGNSVFDSQLVVDTILPFDTVDVYFSVTADTVINVNELFQLKVVSQNVEKLPPADDIEIIIIEEPALLLLSYNTEGINNGLVEPGDSVDLEISLTNYGQALTSSGRYRLSTGGIPMGIADPLNGNIVPNVPLKIRLVAPEMDTTTRISFALTELPRDLNYGEPADIEDTSFSFPVKIASLAADLFIKPGVISSLVTVGDINELFQLELTNTGTSSITDMLLKDITVVLSDHQGRPLPVRSLIEVGNTGFYENDEKVTTAVAGQDKLVLYFSDFIIKAAEQRTIVFKTQLVASPTESFSIHLDNFVVNAEFIDPYLAGEDVEVSSSSGDSTLIDNTFVTAGHTLATSFKIENNPFNPYQGPAGFRYYLKAASRVEFRIFSLIGEEVYARNMPEGDGLVGELNELNWDGRNNNGDMVYNGVYIAIIKILATGEEARMKVAVQK